MAKKITISLNELNNSDNLEDGKPSNTLFTYFVTSPEYFMCFEPQSPQYKKLPLHQELGKSLEFQGKSWAKVGNFSQEFAGIPRISCK